MFITNVKKFCLYEEDNGGGSGGGSADVFNGVEASAAEDQSIETQSGAETEGQESRTPAEAGTRSEAWTPERVAELVKTVAQTTQAQPTNSQPELTEEEINRRLNVFIPTEQHLSDLLEGGPKSVAAMKAIVDGIVKHATTVSWLQAQMMQKQINEQMQPLIGTYQEMQAERLRNEFFATYPELKEQTKLLQAVKASLDQEGAFSGLDKKGVFDKIAQRAKEVLAASGIKPAPSGNAMPVLSRGSQHGAGAAQGGSSAASNLSQELFG